jgi:hypothetical protein
MTPRFVILAAAAALLAGAGQAQAQKYFDLPEWRGQLLRRRPSLQPCRRQPHSAHQRIPAITRRARSSLTAARRLATASARARRFSLERPAPHQCQTRMARLDAARGDAPPPARSAQLHGRRDREPARRSRPLSRLDALPHPWFQRAGDDRTSGLVGLLPHDQWSISMTGSPSEPRWSSRTRRRAR